MYTFGQLRVGDMFNTMSARWVKTSQSEAMSVMRLGCFSIGETCHLAATQEVIILWSGDPAINPASAAAMETEQLAQQAAEFKKSLINERDEMQARRSSLVNYLLSLDSRDPARAWAHRQNDAMVQCIDAIDHRIDLLK